MRPDKVDELGKIRCHRFVLTRAMRLAIAGAMVRTGHARATTLQRGFRFCSEGHKEYAPKRLFVPKKCVTASDYFLIIPCKRKSFGTSPQSDESFNLVGPIGKHMGSASFSNADQAQRGGGFFSE